ncbi:MAG: hypothetical protein JRI36_10585 [Deltaproteobacteria bacterium]|nr:hypothetical protein [Deltaproteobacteria bacterium]
MLIKQSRRDELTASDFLQAARQYVNDRFGLALGSLTAHEAAQILISRGVSRDTADGFKGLLQDAEDAIYTGKGGQRFEASAQVAMVVNALEKEIR